MAGDVLEKDFGEPKPAKIAKGTSAVPSLISEDLTITGNVSAKGEVQVDGQIDGDVRCTTVLISERSQVTGNVVAEDVVVRGKVVGTIKGMRVTLRNNCHVEGDIDHQSLAVEQGAYFEGNSRRSDIPVLTFALPSNR